MRAVVIDEAHLVVEWQVFDICLEQEKMRGERGRLPVQALGYVSSTKVILGLLETAGVHFLYVRMIPFVR